MMHRSPLLYLERMETAMKQLLKLLVIPTLILLWAFSYMYEVRGTSTRNLLLITPLVLLIGGTYLFIAVREYHRMKKGFHSASNIEVLITSKEVKIILLMAVYLLLVMYLGFIPTSFAMMAVMLYVLDMRKMRTVLGFSVISTALLYYAFKIILMIPLPEGLLGI